MAILDGTNLILSVGEVPNEHALGYSTGCKITTSAETGERLTKEASVGKWKEKYVKSLSETITADGFVCEEAETGKPTYDELAAMMDACVPIRARYSLRKNNTREGDTATGCCGMYVITNLEIDAQAGDDAKYSITLENSGAVSRGAISKTSGVHNI